MLKAPRVLIVADHASTQGGGESIIPYHYFRLLRQRNIEAWLVVHERSQAELLSLLPNEQHRIYFIPDTKLQVCIYKLSCNIPPRVSNFTTGLIIYLLTGFRQKQLIKELIQRHSIQVIHQPTPVSPRLPSVFHGLGIPVIIGPMNGSMSYPPGFRQQRNWLQETFVQLIRRFSGFGNQIIPGKREAAVLLVANKRTEQALPKGIKGLVFELPENGVDTSIWRTEITQFDHAASSKSPITRFIFVGRLVDWKAVDLLLLAFEKTYKRIPISLDIIGDGKERCVLEEMATTLGVFAQAEDPLQAGTVRFHGWMLQQDCADHLHQADALILPSLLECGGAVVLEAMASGLPVIATRWGGPMDYLDESCGILVEPSSQDGFIDGLASAMETIAQNPEVGKEMGKKGQEKVLEQFDWNVKIDKVLTIYGQAIRENYS